MFLPLVIGPPQIHTGATTAGVVGSKMPRYVRMQNALCFYLEMMCIIVTKIYLIVGDLVRTEFGFYLPVDKKITILS